MEVVTKFSGLILLKSVAFSKLKSEGLFKMTIFLKKINQNGIAPILIIILVAAIAGSSVLVMKNVFFRQPNSTPKTADSTNSAAVRVATSSAAPATPAPTKTLSPSPKTSARTTTPSPTATPTSQPKTITVSGFGYEDRNNDGLFNSDDPKIPYMQFFIYDSSNNQQISTIYTGQDGQFTLTNTVKGNLIVKPTCNMNFCPKDGSKEFSSSSSNQQFGFRSASAPTSNNNGVIEGDLIIEGSRPYKFYLLDNSGNNYTEVEWAGGHFKINNLPNDRTYTVRISYGDNAPDNTEIALTPSSPEKRTLQIRVR